MNRAPLLAQEAMRAAIGRALEAELTMREHKVFLAIVSLVSHYDRTEDHVANRQLVEATGIDARHVRRALQGLHDKGVIERTPGHGRTASLIRLDQGRRLPGELDGDGERSPSAPDGTRIPSAEKWPAGMRVPAQPEGADSASPEGARMAPAEGADSIPERGPIRPSGGGRQKPASEVPSEVLSEEGAEPDLVDLATSLCSRPLDHHERRGEVKGLLGRLRRIHGDDVVIEALEHLGDKGYRFGWPRELIGELTAALPAARVPGHIPSTTYPLAPAAPAWDLDEAGNAVRVP